MTDDATIDALRRGRHGDPFAVLGPHTGADGVRRIRAWLPGAEAVEVLEGAEGAEVVEGVERVEAAGAGAAAAAATWPLERRHADGYFDAPCPGPLTAGYRLRVRWADGSEQLLDDPYRLGPVLGDADLWLLAEGTHLRPHEVLGASPRTHEGVAGTAFALWAPNASRVSVVGDFNAWNGTRHPMRLRRQAGIWEIFLPGVMPGARYKFEIVTREGALLPLKADPCARQGELRPATASVVSELPPVAPASAGRQRANALDAPVSIYEVHTPSWRRKPEQGDRWLDWDELADTLLPYAADLGFTHVELLPVSEHPFDGSWGYQTLGMYAPTARHAVAADLAAGRGSAAGLRRFVDRAHALGIGVLLDWVPAHFPSDEHGLARFDGSHLYEYADPREGVHADWDTLIYNYGRTEVRNFLVGSALYWLERYGIDGLRVDAVASMLYRDYSRKAGEWVPNVHGGRENLEAIAFLKRANEVVGGERAQAVTLAEESTAFPSVSRPTYAGGLGFHYKWNMGWMHDTLQYLSRDPIHRAHHHDELTFGLVYAWDENFVLPLSHDEVVHGKRSLLSKMPGDRWQRFANLRAYYGFMWAHPGKKLLFMGGEFGQEREWSHDRSLDWHLLDEPDHAGLQKLVRDLNGLLLELPALHRRDFDAGGFEWIDHQDARRNLLAFVRKDEAAGSWVLVVCNFSPVVHRGHRVGVPKAGTWRERLNTDSAHYAGGNVGTPLGAARSEPVASHGRPQSLLIDLPPLAAVFWQWTP